MWLDLEAAERGERYKMAAFTLDGRRVRLFTSPDGIHWQAHEGAGPSGDRSTFFYNPFRKVWAFSLRAEHAAGLNRYRRYVERRDFATARWTDTEAVLWTGADRRDATRPDQGATPELYNLDAVAYESVMLGLFTMFRGERTEREKPNDICLGFSRDGFHWDRTSREPFITRLRTARRLELGQRAVGRRLLSRRRRPALFLCERPNRRAGHEFSGHVQYRVLRRCGATDSPR